MPDNVSFLTKPQLAVEMIERALAAGVPFRWVAADSVYGVGDIEHDLRRAGKGYVLASTPIIGLHPGASRNGLSALPRRSQRRSNDLTGGVCRPALELKDHDCMTGATSNWPISKVKTPTITARSFGHEAC